MVETRVRSNIPSRVAIGWRRLTTVCVVGVTLGLMLLVPSSAVAATLLFDGFESGGFGPGWTSVNNSAHSFWEVQPKSAVTPVITGNYSMTNSCDAAMEYYISGKAWGPFNVGGLPGARIEFDLYQNMVDDISQLNVYGYQGSALPEDTAGMNKMWKYWSLNQSKTWEHVVIPLDSFPTDVFGPAAMNYTRSTEPFWITFKFFSGASSGPGEGVYIDNVALNYGGSSGTAASASISRTPAKSTVSVKRRKGVARYTLGAVLRGSDGSPLPGARVVLLASKNGKSKWKNAGSFVTDQGGAVRKAFSSRKKSTMYYRWIASGASPTSKQKVVVK